MVPIADEIDLPNPDKLDRRQTESAQVGPCDTHPTLFSVRLERAKLAVEIVAAPLAAANLANGHRLHSGGVAIADRAAGSDTIQVEQPARLAAEIGPDLAKATGAAGGCI